MIGSHLPTGKLMQCLIGKIISKLRCKCYPTWFSLSRNVKKFCIFKELDIPPTENIVATSISTVSLVNRYSVGRKLYLIQGYEIWDGWSEKEVNESFCLGLKNIVITKWLKKAVDEACGCVLCSIDYLGVHEFAVNEENALLSSVKDVDVMVRNACRLIDDNKLRIRLAENGQQSVKRFDWEKSVKSFECLLKY